MFPIRSRCPRCWGCDSPVLQRFIHHSELSGSVLFPGGKGTRLKPVNKALEMHSSLYAPYTNEVSCDYLRHLDDLYLAQQQLDGVDEKVITFINRQKAFVKAHPPIAIYRVATEGSQTRNGATIQQVSSSLTFTLDNGWKVRAARKGDQVVYADGSTARIVTAAGAANSNIALVGSRLSNGDEIINTLQRRFLIIVREGVPMAEDFLPALKLADVHYLHSDEVKENIQ